MFLTHPRRYANNNWWYTSLLIEKKNIKKTNKLIKYYKKIFSDNNYI